MSILVTGGAGFIASNLIGKLLKQGKSVVTIDNFDEFYSEDIKIKNVLKTVGLEDRYKEIIELKDKDKKINRLVDIVKDKNYELVYNDIRDIEILDKIFRENKIEMVINIAGLAGVRPSLLKPLEYEQVNIGGFMNLMECCKKYGVKKFVQASSSSVYGNNKKVPFSEEDSVDFPISPYAATKKSCELLGHVYYKLYNIDMIHFRFFTVYGPGQRPDLAIYKFVDLILKGEAIPFYGDGNTFRDYTYIEDIIDGVLKGINYLNNNNNVYEIINLGESNTVSLREMVETIEKILGKKAIINQLPMQPGDVDKTYANIDKAKKILGYNPKTEFEEGMRNFVNWYMEERD